MVDRVRCFSAVRTLVPISPQDAAPADGGGMVVSGPDVAVEENHGGAAQDFLRAHHGVIALGYHACLAREHKHQRPAESNNRQRFISSIQNESAHARTSSRPHPSGARGPAALGMSGLWIDTTRVNKEMQDQLITAHSIVREGRPERTAR